MIASKFPEQALRDTVWLCLCPSLYEKKLKDLITDYREGIILD